jgi:putative PIN family toxin of toxin-antitoxin system
VFVSEIFISGPPYRILKAWSEGKIQFFLSPDIIDEYRRVGDILAADHPSINFTPILEYTFQNAEIYPVQSLIDPVCEDPDDDKFIACALAGECEFIVSGDRHLLKVSGYRNIRVLKPRDFVDEYLA